MKNVEQMNALTLAYVGDAVLELYVRKHLLAQGMTKPNGLHQRAIGYVSAQAEAGMLARLLHTDRLDGSEMAIVRRGRNAKSLSVPKNTSVRTYRDGTAFEALLGYHHLHDEEERVAEIIQWMFRWVEEGETHEG